MLFFCFDFFNVVGSTLVNEIVKPIRIQEICVSAPRNDRRFGRVVVRIIVFGDFDRFALRNVAVVFEFQRFGVVFRMSRNENLPSVFRADRIHAARF